MRGGGGQDWLCVRNRPSTSSAIISLGRCIKPTHTHTHACARTHLHTCTHTYTHMHKRTHTHIHTHAHAHTRTHAHAHAHTCTQTLTRCTQDLADYLAFFVGPHEHMPASETTMLAVGEDLMAHARGHGMASLEKVGSVGSLLGSLEDETSHACSVICR